MARNRIKYWQETLPDQSWVKLLWPSAQLGISLQASVSIFTLATYSNNTAKPVYQESPLSVPDHSQYLTKFPVSCHSLGDVCSSWPPSVGIPWDLLNKNSFLALVFPPANPPSTYHSYPTCSLATNPYLSLLHLDLHPVLSWGLLSPGARIKIKSVISF